ncbi:MAG: hypothetical protein N3B12_06835 [Armatimonadetes bacterium]|nr:hypothetical protein [Armatimonadota bacterium]
MTLVLLISSVAHLLAIRLAPRLRLIKSNFLNRPVLGSYGVISFVDIAGLIGAGLALGIVSARDAVLYLTVMGSMCVLGLIDDVFGSREVGGFRGHFTKLFVERKITTGAIKAVGGGIVGIVAGWEVSGGNTARWVTAALIIPLSANVLNIVDLRPCRAVAVFFLGLVVTCVLACGRLAAPWIVLTIALVSLAWAVADSRGRAMMGDSGSNSLGAALGLTIALSLKVYWQIGAIVLLAAVNWYSEKHSISELIAKNRILRAVDNRLGVR